MCHVTGPLGRRMAPRHRPAHRRRRQQQQHEPDQCHDHEPVRPQRTATRGGRSAAAGISSTPNTAVTGDGARNLGTTDAGGKLQDRVEVFGDRTFALAAGDAGGSVAATLSQSLGTPATEARSRRASRGPTRPRRGPT